MGQIPFMFRQKALMDVTGQTLRPGGLMLTRRAVEICDFGQHDLVLDAGCGYGMTTRYLREEYHIPAVGLDAAFDMADRAYKKNSGPRFVIPGFIQSILPGIPFRSRAFAGIFCECVLSLIPDKKKCLNEFFRILKKNGKLVLTDLYIPKRFEKSISQRETPVSCLDGAITLQDMIKIIEAAGFQIDIMEDHTQLLKQLAGQMVFEHGSLNHFWEKLSGTVCDSTVSQACRAGFLKPGYCMMIAGKYE